MTYAFCSKEATCLYIITLPKRKEGKRRKSYKRREEMSQEMSDGLYHGQWGSDSASDCGMFFMQHRGMPVSTMGLDVALAVVGRRIVVPLLRRRRAAGKVIPGVGMIRIKVDHGHGDVAAVERAARDAVLILVDAVRLTSLGRLQGALQVLRFSHD